MDPETRKSWRGKLGELVDGTKMGLSIMGLIVLDFIAVLGEVFIFLTEVTVCSYKCDGLKPIRLYDSKFKNGGLDLAPVEHPVPGHLLLRLGLDVSVVPARLLVLDAVRLQS